MPRVCEPCRFYSADDGVTGCPTCGGPVKFTLLTGVVGATEPEPEGGASLVTLERPARRKLGAADLVTGKTGVVTAGVVVAVVALVVVAWFVSGGSLEDRAAKVRPGMRMADAVRVMGDPNRPKKTALFRFTIGGSDDPDRMPDFDRPLDTTGDGFVEYKEGFRGVRIRYAAGVVTAVEPYTPSGGMRRRVTVYE